MGEAQTLAGRLDEFKPSSSWTASLPRLKEFLGDYHIIPGAKCVVSPQGLEAGARKSYEIICEKYGGVVDWRDPDVKPENWAWVVAMFRAALEAAGITVCNEVVEVRGDSPVTVGWRQPEEAVMIMLERGDTIWIKRKED